MTQANALDSALDHVNRRLATHAGGVRADRLDEDGVLHLRFTGMCSACLSRPLTMATVIAPAFERVEGVRGVQAPGTRVSPAAASRLAALGATV